MKINKYLKYIKSDEFRNLPELIELPEYLWRCPTRNAIDNLAKKFNLLNHRGMQDWEYEVSDFNRIDEFINSYLNDNLNDDEKFTLMETIIESFLNNEDFKTSKRWENLLQIIEKNRKLHISTIHSWSNFYGDEDVNSIDEIGSYFRFLWETYNNEFIDKEKDREIYEYKSLLNYNFIKEQLNLQISESNKVMAFNHFNPQNYLAFHNNEKIKNSFLDEIKSYLGSKNKSHVWNWAKEKFNLSAEYFFDEEILILGKIEEELGIPKSIVCLFEEIYSNIKTLSSNETSIKIVNELYYSIKIGKDLSLFTPKYHYWLLIEYSLPKLEMINIQLSKEMQNYIILTSELFLNYINNKFESIENLEYVIKYVRDWGFLISEKMIDNRDKMDENIYFILDHIHCLVNNVSGFLTYGANATNWVVNTSNLLNKSNVLNEWDIIKLKVLELLNENE